MTMDEAIQLFKEMESKEMYWQLQELCDLAIEALSADVSTKNTNTSTNTPTNTPTDLISRADAVEAVCGGCSIETKNNCKEEGDCYEVQNLKALPSAEPKRGEWVPISKGEKGYSAGDFKCSVCGKPNKCYSLTAYCPNCGAYMGVSE